MSAAEQSAMHITPEADARARWIQAFARRSISADASSPAPEGDFDLQAGRLHVAHGHRPAAGFDARLDDGQAEAGAAGFAGARGFGTKERIEEPVQRFLRDAWTAAYDDEPFVTVLPDSAITGPAAFARRKNSE